MPIRMSRTAFLPLLALVALGCGGSAESIKIEPSKLDMTMKNEGTQLAAVVLNAKREPISGAKVEWSSSDPKVATVDNGKVTAVSSGIAIITAKSGEVDQQCYTNVHIPTKATIEPPQVTLRGAGASVTLTLAVIDDKGKQIAGPQVAWSSDNPAVATVADSVVTAVADGQARITARSGEAAAVVEVSVKGPLPTTITIDPSPVVLKAGASQQLNVQVMDDLGLPMSNVQLSWTSADPGVAEIGAGGLLVARRRGDTTVTATWGAATGSVPVKVR